MVARETRFSRLAVDLARTCYLRGLELGTGFDFIDCNAHLVCFFTRFGKRQLFERVHHPEYGEVVPLVLVMHDVQHLDAIGSPFAEIGKRFEDRSHSVHFFRNFDPKIEAHTTVRAPAQAVEELSL